MARKQKPLVKCHFCGQVGRTETVWRGSKALDIFIWLVLLFPGPLYTYWRWQGRRELCRHCSSDNFEVLPPEQQPEEIRLAMEAEAAKHEKKPVDLGYEEHRF